MGTAKINPESKNWAFLEAGRYGPGMDIDAECEVVEYECPSTENPGYDKEGKRGPYAFFRIRVQPADTSLPMVRVRHWECIAANSGSRALGWLANIGIPVADDGTHETDMVPGKECCVEMAEPSLAGDGSGKKYDRLKDLFGV